MGQQQTLEQHNTGDAQVTKTPKDSQISSLSQLGSVENAPGTRSSSGTQEVQNGQINVQSMFSPNNLAAELGIGSPANQSADTSANGLMTLGNEFTQWGKALSTVGTDLKQLGQDFNTFQSDVNKLLGSLGNATNGGGVSNDGGQGGHDGGTNSGNGDSGHNGGGGHHHGHDCGGGNSGAGSDTGSGSTGGAGSDTGSGSTGGAGSDTGTETTTTTGSDGGGVITGTAQPGGSVTDLPNTSDLQTLANAMTANAMNSGEWQAGDFPITLAPGDATIVNGGSVTDAQGNVFSLQQMPNWPAGVVTENGVPIPQGDYTDALRIVNGQLYAESAKGNGWWKWDGSQFDLVGADPGTSGGAAPVTGSDTPGAATNTGSDTTGSAPAGSDTTVPTAAGSDTVAPPTAPANTSDGGIVTGNFGSSSGGVTDLPQNGDLQTLADTMTTNALSSGEFNTPGHGTPVTFAPGDVTPVSGTSVTVGGHTFSLTPTNGYPSGDLTEDGNPVQFGGWSAAIRVVNGQLWVEDAKTMGWRTFDGNGGWSSFQGDPGIG